jgi:AcrR family transcriptional regulator
MARRARPGAHDALLDAAREEFARAGLERARVEDVARRAGISKGAFYLHFRSKDDAFREIVQRFLGALEDHARRRHEAEDRLAGEVARGAATAAVQFEAECALDADLLELLWRNRQLVAAVDGASRKLYRDLIADFRRRMHARIARRIAERQAAGALRADVAPEVVADLVMGAYDELARRMADLKEKPDLAGWARSMLVVLYEGLLARPRAAARRAAPRR